MTESIDIFMIVLWGLAILVSLILTIIAIVQKDKSNFEEFGMWLIVSITPGGMLIGLIGFIILMCLCIFLPFQYLFKSITKNW